MKKLKQIYFISTITITFIFSIYICIYWLTNPSLTQMEVFLNNWIGYLVNFVLMVICYFTLD